MIRGKVYALDIDAEMLTITESKAKLADVKNIVTMQRDFVEDGSD